MSELAKETAESDRRGARTRPEAAQPERIHNAPRDERRRWLWMGGAGGLCYLALRLAGPAFDEPRRSLIADATWSVFALAVMALAIYDLRQAKLDEERRAAWRAGAAVLLFLGLTLNLWIEDSRTRGLVTALAWLLFGMAAAACVVRDLRKARPRY